MIAIDVSAASGPPPQGGIASMTRQQVAALLRVDPETRYALCYRWSRWRRGHLIPADAANARLRIVRDPWNALLIPRARLLHSTSHFLMKTPRIPKCVTLHDLHHVRFPEWSTPRHLQRNLDRLGDIAARADCVITPSRFTADEVADVYGVPEQRLRVVPNGVDCTAFHPLPADDPGVAGARARHGDFVLAVGLVVRRKNFTRLAQAVARIKGLGLVVVGRPGDDFEALQATVREHGLGARFTHLDSVEHEALLALLAAARAFAVPSLYEGFGLVLAEALAAGVPTLSSDAASLPEVAHDAALQVDASDVDALHAGLERVVHDEALREDLRRRGPARAAELSWEASARTLRGVYGELL